MNYINRSSLDSLRIYRSKKMIEAQKRNLLERVLNNSTKKYDYKLAKEIIRLICEHKHMSWDMIMTKTREKNVLITRQLCIYFISKKTYLLDKEIAKLFNCDRSTVWYVVNNAIPSWLPRADFKTIFDEIEIKIDEHIKTILSVTL